MAKVKGLLENDSPGVAVELMRLKLTLTEKNETIKKLDEAIIDMLENSEDVESEIETSSEFISEVYGGLAAIDERVEKIEREKIGRSCGTIGRNRKSQ